MTDSPPCIERVLSLPAKAVLTELADEYAAMVVGTRKRKRQLAFEGFVLVQRAAAEPGFLTEINHHCFERIGKQPDKLSLAVMLCIIGPRVEGADKEASKYGRVIDVLMHLGASREVAWDMINRPGIVGLATLAAAMNPRKKKRAADGDPEARYPDQDVGPFDDEGYGEVGDAGFSADAEDSGDDAAAAPTSDAPVDEGDAAWPQDEAAPGPVAEELGEPDTLPAEAEQDEPENDPALPRGVFRCTRAVLGALLAEQEGIRSIAYKLIPVGLERIELEFSFVDDARDAQSPTP